MLTRSFLFIALASLCLGSLAKSQNIVWIIADDMSPDIAAYGATGVQTPNLDRLAQEGRRFDRAYATAPVCSASRSAFILGCYQTTTGLYPHDTENPQPLPQPYQPLPTLLRSAGWHVTNAPAPATVRNGRPIKKAKTHYNFAHTAADLYQGDDFRKRQPDQRFFAQFQITEPHRPFPIPPAYDEAAVQAIPLPPNYPDDPLVRRDWYAYLRSVEVVDQRVGSILSLLEAEGVLDQTLVIFFADHGRPMPWGKQWLSDEGLHVPLLMRGPGITPSSVETRLVSLIDLAPTALQLADLAIPDWMEGKPLLTPQFPDRTHVFAARDRCGDAQDRIRAVITPTHWLVRHYHPGQSRLNWSSYKEDQYPGMPLLRILAAEGKLSSTQAFWLTPTRPELELYDLTADPLTQHSVADSPAQASSRSALHALLDQQFTPEKDPGTRGDPATEPSLEEIQKSKRADYARNWTKRLKKPDPTDAERLAWWRSQYGLTDK